MKTGKSPSGQVSLAIGVFALIAGSILSATNLFKPTSSMAEMQGMTGMEGMSMEQMMRVDGSANVTPVTVQTAKAGPFEASIRYAGSVRPYLEVTVYPRIAGRLSNYNLYPGDRVVAGQVLARLDAAELTANVEAARSEADAAQAELAAARAEIAEHHQEVERMAADYAYWEKELPRAQTLLERGVISQAEFDKEKSEARAAQALLRGVQLKVRRLEAQLARSKAVVAQARARARGAATTRSYTAITSPLTGIVQERMADPGVVVEPGMGILKIGDYRRVRLQANVAEQDLNAVSIGTAVAVTLPGRTGTLAGRVSSIFPKAGDTTRTVTVEAVVNNPGNRLRAGQFLDMRIVTARRTNALSVPKSALSEFGDRPAVWVLSGQFPRRRMVVTGLESKERVEITGGLAPGEAVIVSGQEQLTAGTRVVAVDDAGQPVAAMGGGLGGDDIRIRRVGPQPKPVMGDNRLVLEVQDPKTGQPLKVDDLEVGVAMPMKNMSPMAAEVEVKPDPQPGRFKVDTYLGMEGVWEVTVKVKDRQRQGLSSFTLDNRKRGSS